MDLFETWAEIVVLHSRIYRAIDPGDVVALMALGELVNVAALAAATVAELGPLQNDHGPCVHGYFPSDWPDRHICAEAIVRGIGKV